MPGALSVGVPSAEGVRDTKGVADELFNTDSEPTELADGLILWLPSVILAVWLTVVEPLALRLGGIDSVGVTVPSGDGLSVARGVDVPLCSGLSVMVSEDIELTV